MWSKQAESVGSAPPDGIQSQAAAMPGAPTVVANKTAPGQTGPKGLAPRTTYSRVNTGSIPTPSFGEQAKTIQPRGLEFLPAKVAHDEEKFMTSMMRTPSLGEMVKAAMEGTVAKIDISAAAARALGQDLPASGSSPQQKTASTEPSVPDNTVDPEVCEKYAEALEYMAGLKLAADPASPDNASPGVGPGEGAGALTVTESTPKGENIDAGQSGQAVAANVQPMKPSMESDPGKASNPANAMATNQTAQPGAAPVDPLNNGTASNAPQKTASAAQRNLEALLKIAQSSDPEGHHLRRALLGNPVSAAIEARKGDKGKAFKETWGHGVTETLKGSGKGLALGAAAGTAAGAIHGLAGGKRGLSEVGKRALQGAAIGGGSGAVLGNIAGSIKGHHGSEASKLHGKYSKNKEASALELSNLAVLRKIAEDASAPAAISTGTASATGAKAPDGVSSSGEGPVPAVPSTTASQAALVATNQAAIDYTKRDAKDNMRRDMAQLLAEPMQSAQGDAVLAKTLDHTGAAGAKIAAAKLTKAAAAHALLLKLSKEQEAGAAKKVKTSTMGGADLSTPQGQSGFNAATTL